MAVDVAGKFRKRKFVQYHKIIASSFARIAQHFACSKYDKINFNASNIDEKNNVYEKSENKQFHLVREWKNADPPIVLLNAPYLTHISAPNLFLDFSFQLQNSSNSYTLLCNNLDKCKHSDAAQWKLVQKIMQTAKLKNAEWGLFNFQKSVTQKNQIDDQKSKIRLILKVCGGFRCVSDMTNQIKPILDENERQQLIDQLYYSNRDYVLTFDNVIKIVSIFFRVNSGIPLLVMGETGCGKTKLLRYMANILQLDMIVVDVNGGYNNNHLHKDIYNSQQIAIQSPNKTILLFFDKINSSKCIAAFKEIF
eukprot:281555_1